MFQYEFEKRPPSSSSCASRDTTTTEWSRSCPSPRTNHSAARRPLPPTPIMCQTIPEKTTVPLKVWIIASASCFAVCAALVLATVVITKWGTADSYTTRELYAEAPVPIHSQIVAKSKLETYRTTEPPVLLIDDIDNNEIPILEKLSIFKNVIGNREHRNLVSKPQIHPLHDNIEHEDRNIKKKDKAVIENINEASNVAESESNKVVVAEQFVPNFKPTLPELIFDKELEMNLPYGYLDSMKDDYYYNDQNLYDDYMQSNSMTSYLLEKVQELYDWTVSDPDLNNNASRKSNTNEFSSVLKALNDSLLEGNVSIIMSKLKDIYFGQNYTNGNNSIKIITTNSTDLVSFGILTLDIMLLHNIQLMAWESQETARLRMLKDPDVFAFNALFLEPSQVEAKQKELVHGGSIFLKRLNPRQDLIEDMDLGKNFLENLMEVGMSTARAAIHLGRAYKNTRNLVTQISNKESLSANIQSQMSRNIDANTHALNHLQTSFDSYGVANSTGAYYTELDCIWLLYCRNLMATSKLNAPYGTMARINGVALRMLTGELAASKALDTMLYELLSGWTELRCNDMFPRCSRVNAASVVMDSILQPYRKSQASKKGR